ncbi:hypothetical protein [Ideonella sp.]|uniref:hypothetical protein n=1 Tax=Ideonella sp. TaxID=1929293 RepID=UPI0035AE6D94
MSRSALVLPAPRPRRRGWARALWLLLALMGLAAVVMATVLVLAAVYNELPPTLNVTVDGEPVFLAGLGLGELLLGGLAVCLALFVTMVVVPLALLFGLGVPLLLAALAGVAALALGAVALATLGSPLIVGALLLWWLLRPARRAAPAAPMAAPVAPPPVPRVGEHTDNATPLA